MMHTSWSSAASDSGKAPTFELVPHATVRIRLLERLDSDPGASLESPTDDGLLVCIRIFRKASLACKTKESFGVQPHLVKLLGVVVPSDNRA